MASTKPRKPFTAEDLYLHRKVMGFHGLPAHEAGVFVVRTPDRESDGYFTHLWCSPGADSPPKQLTFGGWWSDQSPRLSPDGKCIAFLSNRTGVAKPYLLELEGGEAKAVGRVVKEPRRGESVGSAEAGSVGSAEAGSVIPAGAESVIPFETEPVIPSEADSVIPAERSVIPAEAGTAGS